MIFKNTITIKEKDNRKYKYNQTQTYILRVRPYYNGTVGKLKEIYEEYFSENNIINYLEPSIDLIESINIKSEINDEKEEIKIIIDTITKDKPFDFNNLKVSNLIEKNHKYDYDLTQYESSIEKTEE